ncbi:MAG: hypothetical protein RL885_32580 [Planctomycetota bacterium]
MPRPVFISSPELEARQPTRSFSLNLTLWGRRALDALPDIERAVGILARKGLTVDGRRVAFEIIEVGATEVFSLGDFHLHSDVGVSPELVILLETPLILGGSLDRIDPLALLRRCLGNAAYELVAWDIEERDTVGILDRWARDELATAGRAHVDRLGAELELRSSQLHRVRVGVRRSRSTGSDFELRGVTGYLCVGGNLGPVLPWLQTASLGGLGQKRTQGFGEVRLATRLD